MDAFSRNEDLLEERELFVVLINFEFYQSANLFTGGLTGGDLGEVMDDWRHLLIDPVFDERDCFGSERLCERCAAVRKIIQAPGDKISHLGFERLGGRQSLYTFFEEVERTIERFVAHHIAQTALE